MKQKYLKNIVTLELNKDKCNGCRMCTYVCPHNVYEMQDKKASIIDRDACMECGACSINCPTEAISVEAGVGCAYALLLSPDGTCGCGDDGKSSGCCG